MLQRGVCEEAALLAWTSVAHALWHQQGSELPSPAPARAVGLNLNSLHPSSEVPQNDAIIPSLLKK